MFVIVTTAPRPRPTVLECLNSMCLAGFERPVVLSDGDNLSMEGVIRNKPPLGGFKSWCKALDLGVQSRRDWVLICEDDILWCPNAFTLLAQDLGYCTADDFGYLSLYTCRRVSSHLEQRYGVHKRGTLEPGVYESRLGWSTWGSQALLFSRESAIALQQSEAFKDYRKNYGKNRNRDAIVSKCLTLIGRRTWFRIPSLVNHTLGEENSSLGPKGLQLGLRSDYVLC